MQHTGLPTVGLVAAMAVVAWALVVGFPEADSTRSATNLSLARSAIDVDAPYSPSPLTGPVPVPGNSARFAAPPLQRKPVFAGLTQLTEAYHLWKAVETYDPRDEHGGMVLVSLIADATRRMQLHSCEVAARESLLALFDAHLTTYGRLQELKGQGKLPDIGATTSTISPPPILIWPGRYELMRNAEQQLASANCQALT